MHRFDSDGRGDALSGDIITPSSWRTGKELAEKILREQRQQQREERLGFKPSDHHSPASGSQLSSYRDSLDVDSQSSHSVLSKSYDSLSDATSLGENRPKDAGTDSGSDHDSFHSSVLERRPLAPQLSSDINQLLQELEATSREFKSDAATGVRPLGGKAGGRGPSAEPVKKKTKYNSGKESTDRCHRIWCGNSNTVMNRSCFLLYICRACLYHRENAPL